MQPADRSHVTVREVPGGGSTYAINLASEKVPFTPEEVAAATQATGVRTYVSEALVGDEKWYRLRAGPFLSENDARQVLAAARTRYPKAWLGCRRPLGGQRPRCSWKRAQRVRAATLLPADRAHAQAGADAFRRRTM
jgi:hypothetical protein